MKVYFRIEAEMDPTCDSGSPYDFVREMTNSKMAKLTGVEIRKVAYCLDEGFSPDDWTDVEKRFWKEDE